MLWPVERVEPEMLSGRYAKMAPQWGAISCIFDCQDVTGLLLKPN